MSNFFNLRSLGSSSLFSSSSFDNDTESDNSDDSNRNNNENAEDLVWSISSGRRYIHKKIYANGLWNLQNRTGAHNDAMVALEKIDWGFRYEDTTYPVQAYMGDEDDNVPLQAWSYMSSRMSNVKLNVIKGSGHYLLYRMDFMDDLFTDIKKAVYSEDNLFYNIGINDVK